jgi:hypothetical protein
MKLGHDFYYGHFRVTERECPTIDSQCVNTKRTVLNFQHCGKVMASKGKPFS